GWVRCVYRRRRSAGLSQKELADMAGVSQGAIAMLEKRQRTQPHPQTVHKLAQALGITPDDP
ncbi:MAG: helix-turn-helix domain-containing protein, partial [Rubrobacteraceae bacterium]